MAGNIDIVSSRKPVDFSLTSDVVEKETGHKNMLHLIHLRWMAVVGQLLTIIVTTFVLGVKLPLPNMLSVLVCLAAFNLANHLRWQEERVATDRTLFLSLLVDVASLTLQLYFSGGINNPFAFLFLFQVILSAVLLRSKSTWTIVVITTCCLVVLSLFNRPLIMPAYSNQIFPSLYTQGLLICFVLNAVLLVFFITRIASNLRAGDAYLAALKQNLSEEEHIVRMGLLASGAAHELGTPMATMSVIVGDWKHMPAFVNDPELQNDLKEIQTQLLRCKSIVSGILMSAGQTRGEFSQRSSVHDLLEQLTEEWRSSRTVETFAYQNLIKEEFDVVWDSTFKQMLFNVLDNALEASPKWVGFIVDRTDNTLKLQIIDQGKGFLPTVIDKMGTPYNSTKGRPGSGLGLFLVLNVARKLGGSVKARNREEGGAVVSLNIPLSSLQIQDELDGDGS